MLKLPKFKGRALHAVAALSGSALLAQVASLVAAPILARLYVPSEYGTLAAVTSVVGPVTLLAGLQLTSAIIVEPDEDDVDVLLGLVVCAGVVGAVLVALAGVFAREGLHRLLHVPLHDVRVVATLASASVFFGILAAATSALANRERAYALLAASRLSGTLVGIGINIAFGVFKGGWLGLLVGFLSAVVCQCLICSWAVRGRLGRAATRKTLLRGVSILAKYRRYPLYVLPSDILNSLITQAPVYALASLATAEATGAYSMGQRMLGAPIVLLSSSIGEVFTRSAADEYHARGECRSLFMTVFKSLTIAALGMFVLIALLGPDVFAWFLGERWRSSGQLVRVMAPMMALKFVASPLSYMYIITGHQREDLLSHCAFAVLVALAAFTAAQLQLASVGVVALLAAASFLFYGWVLVRSWRFASVPATASHCAAAIPVTAAVDGARKPELLEPAVSEER